MGSTIRRISTGTVRALMLQHIWGSFIKPVDRVGGAQSIVAPRCCVLASCQRHLAFRVDGQWKIRHLVPSSCLDPRCALWCNAVGKPFPWHACHVSCCRTGSLVIVDNRPLINAGGEPFAEESWETLQCLWMGLCSSTFRRRERPR